MIRIRYESAAGAGAPSWLYGRAEADGRDATVYLRPALTAGQRRAVLRRLRQEAARGLGPPLPLSPLLRALARDRIATAGGTAVSVVRLHPVAAAVPGAVAAALAAVFVVASAGGPAALLGHRPNGRPQAAMLQIGAGPQLRPMVMVTARGVDGRRSLGRQASQGQPVSRPAPSATWYVTPHAATPPELPR